ncbi:hypothetical protein [Haloferax sulfurifontis]|uniref:Lipoprotein n=1 Tax=Haloferax sulfurifontis TaxID=255616 RepID=A0A830E005_9EURY|nr:hypothetical protein [Haloferax sulfurifontis]GGC56761.1 hypothetical protein GCM10007209_18190 [Haloferax sulfurifontis]
MHRRALLSSAAALSLAGLSGCLADARRTASGRIRADTGHSRLHPADEQYVKGTFPEDADVRGWLFADPPDDQTDVFTDRAMQGRYSNDLLGAAGDSFVLLFEVRMAREDAAFYNIGLSPSWTGWRDADIPIRRSAPADLEPLDADTFVCTHLSTFDVARGAAPTNATLRVFEREDESGTTHGTEPEQTVATYRVGRWSDR